MLLFNRFFEYGKFIYNKSTDLLDYYFSKTVYYISRLQAYYTILNNTSTPKETNINYEYKDDNLNIKTFKGNKNNKYKHMILVNNDTHTPTESLCRFMLIEARIKSAQGSIDDSTNITINLNDMATKSTFYVAHNRFDMHFFVWYLNTVCKKYIHIEDILCINIVDDKCETKTLFPYDILVITDTSYVLIQ